MSSFDHESALPVGTEFQKQEPQWYRAEFRGHAGEYFKIWIVNVILILLTFGIYSAWAKVRTRRYFYGNTYLADSSFGYHADPLKILKGRAILFFVFGVYTLITKLAPALAFVGWAFLLAVFPYILVKAMMFNLANSSYRNIRFGFRPAYQASYLQMLKSWLLLIVTLGLGYPVMMYWFNRFTINNSRYGTQYFSFKSSWQAFYKIYAMAGAIVMLISILIGTAGAGIGRILIGPAAGADAAKIGIGFAIFGVYFGGLIAAAYIRAKTPNLVASSTELGPIQFRSELKTSRMVWLYVTNALAIAFTFGLMLPWALVRMAKYRSANTMILAEPNLLDQFIQGEIAKPSAVADAAVDIGDFDLGI